MDLRTITASVNLSNDGQYGRKNLRILSIDSCQEEVRVEESKQSLRVRTLSLMGSFAKKTIRTLRVASDIFTLPICDMGSHFFTLPVSRLCDKSIQKLLVCKAYIYIYIYMFAVNNNAS